MFGVEVLTWFQRPNEEDSYFSLLEDYLFTGAIGHSALKITIPSSPEMDAMVEKYCKEDGEEIIPHFKKNIFIRNNVKDRQGKTIRYERKSVPAWEIYFSFWPKRRLNEEDEDCFAENLNFDVKYKNEWLEYLKVSYREKPQGVLRAVLPERLYRFLFGNPPLVPEPIISICHSSIDTLANDQAVGEIQKNLMLYEQQAGELLEKYRIIKQKIFCLEVDLKVLKERLETPFVPPWEKAPLEENIAQIKKKLKKLEPSEKSLFQSLEKKAAILQKTKQTLRQAKHKLYQHFSVGLAPTQSVFLPISSVSEMPYGLDLVPMLKMIRQIVLKENGFNILFNNCTSTVSDVLLAGCQTVKSEMTQKKLLKPTQFYGDLVATPSRLSTFAGLLSDAFTQLNLLFYQEKNFLVSYSSQTSVKNDVLLEKALSYQVQEKNRLSY